MRIKFNIFKVVSEAYRDSCISLAFNPTKIQRTVMGLLGVVLLSATFVSDAHAGGGTFGFACQKMLLLVEGAFGALVAAVAGVAAILAAALGGFKMAWSLVVVSIGAFILRSWILLFQGSCGGCPTC